jgi:amidase
MEREGSNGASRAYDRKAFLGKSAVVAATPVVGGYVAQRARAAISAPAAEIEEMTIAQMQAEMAAGRLSAHQLVQKYLSRIDSIDRRGPRLNSVIEVNPDAERIARDLDAERRRGNIRGPLHGVPILLKDNIDTGDRMQTTAGSLGLVGRPAAKDATVADKLRKGGAVILGKTNLSEWANFRSFSSSSGWSGRGGQCCNPYVLDRNPCGSSSGSGAAVSANLTAGSLGTETDGSIVCPANNNGVVGIKPTVGLTSRAGVVPISHSQDGVGPHCRTVADAAAVLSAIVSKTPDPRDPATSPNRNKVFTDYTQFVNPKGLQGARIGIARAGMSGFSDETNAVFEAAVQAIKDAGAVVFDPVDIPTIDDINSGADEIVVLVFEFKDDLNAYLATRSGVPITSLASAIAFNNAHADTELKFFGQEWFELAEARINPFTGNVITPAEYQAALAHERLIGGPQGIDAALASHNLDALVSPTGTPAWTTDVVNGDHFLGASSSPAAIAGYPSISVPAGDAFGLPVGISFIGTAFSEPTLIKVASGFEAATKARKPPTFLPALPDENPTFRFKGGGGKVSFKRITNPACGRH